MQNETIPMSQCSNCHGLWASSCSSCCPYCGNETNIIVHKKAKCSYCKNIVNSNFNLAFFTIRENSEYNSYYCGCRGWD
jgi:hypothetical protein